MKKDLDDLNKAMNARWIGERDENRELVPIDLLGRRGIDFCPVKECRKPHTHLGITTNKMEYKLQNYCCEDGHTWIMKIFNDKHKQSKIIIL